MSGANSIAQRVRGLIDSVHGGSVNAAARDTGIPQRTLARIADGSVENPRADSLQRLATFYRTSLEWLLSGQGNGPQHPPVGEANDVALREMLRVNMLQTRLGLSTNAAGAVNIFPNSITAAAMSLHEAAGRKGFLSPRLVPNIARERQNWLDFIDSAIEVYGEDRVARWLERNWKHVAERFTLSSAARKSG